MLAACGDAREPAAMGQNAEPSGISGAVNAGSGAAAPEQPATPKADAANGAAAGPSAQPTDTATSPASAGASMSANTPADANSGAGATGSANAQNGQNAANAKGTSPNGSRDATADTPTDMGASATPAVELPVDMGTPTLYWLDIAGGTVTRASADGSNAKVVASGSPLSAPDGVTVDPEGGHFYVLNMGTVIGGGNSGSLVRYDLDGSNPEVIMKPGTQVEGITFNTGKQVNIDRVNHKLYLGDREGSKVWRCDYDGGNLEILVSGHEIRQIVGVAADPIARQFYFSDRNGKKLFRANMDMPAGQTHADRDDVELIYAEKASSAMPLDIELDVKNRKVYWTDRRQYKVLGMNMDMPAGEDATTRTDVETLASGLTEAIGLAFDHEQGVLYVTHSGSVSMVNTDGTGLARIGSNGSTGISFARLP